MLKRPVAFLAVAVSMALLSPAFAAVWDEPWHREVVSRAHTLGLYDVVTASPTKTIFKRVKTLAGANTGEAVEVDGLYATIPLATSSRGGGRPDDELALRFGLGRRYYLFLQKAQSGGAWRIATPTTGFAELRADGMVVATFRHSLHKAVVDTATYELTQTCIFTALHNTGRCQDEVYQFINAQVALEPAGAGTGASTEEQARFFSQHAALETAYLIGYSVNRDALTKFLAAPFFHTQISAVRALAKADPKDRNSMLMAFVTDDTRNLLARVFAVQMIREIDARDLKAQIEEYRPKASQEPVGLGARITDSRIGTDFPDSLRDALDRLLATWK